MSEHNTIIKIENVSKEYRLGAISGGTLYGDLQSFWARLQKKEDPNTKIGAKTSSMNERFFALKNINLEVVKGETLGIIGANGAGKSTLLKLLCRVTAPTTGKISYNGRIASILEVGTGFHPEMTGRENVYMNGAILGMTKKEIDNKLQEIISFAEMEQFIDTPVKRYSSGMYVRLAFAVVAHLDSDIMIVDEVLAVGDAKFQQKCLGRIDRAASEEKRTVLYVSHNMATVRSVCTRCIVLNKGEIVFDGEPEEAISVYMDQKSKMKTSYDWSKQTEYDEVQVKEITLLDTDDCVYAENSKIKIKIMLKSRYDIDDFYVRFAFFTLDDQVVGASFSKPFRMQFGEGEYIATFDTEGLAEGKYYVKLLLTYINEFGIFKKYGGLHKAFDFEIIRDDTRQKLVWLHKYWGHVKLKQMTVEKITELDLERKDIPKE